jgi:CRISPR/Cas system-associated exonuclease Cas4 (RecB family)
MMIPGKELDSSSEIPIIRSSSDIIRQLQPVVIPRITAISHMAVCERAAYNIEFLGMQSGDFTASGEIGSAVHRIVIKSTLEIINSIKKGNGSPISKSNAIDLFRNNAIDDVDINWKRFALAGIEKPFPTIMEDLDIRAERLVNQLLLLPLADNKKKKKQEGGRDRDEDGKDGYESRLLLRPEFTIRNLQIPLEGRLDLVKIKLAKVLPEYDKGEDNYNNNNNKNSKYTSSDDLTRLKIDDVEIIQIKTGKARPRNARWNLQADAEALLLMKALKLEKPPRYTWQFADKDGKREKFDFTKVYDVVNKFIKLWKSEVAPAITGYCQNCPLKEGCLGWSFAANNKLSQEDRERRRVEFNLSKRIREEISYVDRWKVYVNLKNPQQRQEEGSAITNLRIDMNCIDLESQEIKLLYNDDDNLVSKERSGEYNSQQQQPLFINNFVDFSVGDYVTISDGNPNLGSNPTAIITDIDVDKQSLKLQLYRNDIYFLLHENRYNSRLTIDRFGFSGLKTMQYLDDFFRDSPYADIILQRTGMSFAAREMI